MSGARSSCRGAYSKDDELEGEHQRLSKPGFRSATSGDRGGVSMPTNTAIWATIAVVVTGLFLACVTFFGGSTESSSGAGPLSLPEILDYLPPSPRRAAQPAAVSPPGHRLGSCAVRQRVALQAAFGSGSYQPALPAASASATTAPAAASGPSSATPAALGSENGWRPASRARTTSARCAATLKSNKSTHGIPPQHLRLCKHVASRMSSCCKTHLHHTCS